MVDKVGRRAGFVLTPGNAHEPHWLSGLLDGAPANELIADKAYDTNAALALLAERGITTVIPSRANRQAPRRYAPRGVRDASFGGEPVCGHPIKGFRGIATRYCKRALMYGGLLNPVSTFVAFREAVSQSPAGGRPAVNRRLAL